MAIEKTQRGFALLVAVIFMSVVLSFGLTLGSLGYKQAVLASSAIESQYAFYAADAALECALYSDTQGNFTYSDHDGTNRPNPIICENASAARVSYVYDATWLVDTQRLSFDAGRHCADVTIYKYSSPQPGGITTYIFSQGYDVSCATVANPNGARFSSRGLSFHY
jgi:hypothetical protein